MESSFNHQFSGVFTVSCAWPLRRWGNVCAITGFQKFENIQCFARRPHGSVPLGTARTIYLQGHEEKWPSKSFRSLQPSPWNFPLFVHPLQEGIAQLDSFEFSNCLLGYELQSHAGSLWKRQIDRFTWWLAFDFTSNADIPHAFCIFNMLHCSENDGIIIIHPSHLTVFMAPSYRYLGRYKLSTLQKVGSQDSMRWSLYPIPS